MQDAVPEDFVNRRGCRLSEHKQQVLERQDDGADQKGLIVLRRRGNGGLCIHIYPQIGPNASHPEALWPVKEGDRDDCTRDTVSR